MNKGILAITLMTGISPPVMREIALASSTAQQKMQTTETLHNHTYILPTCCFSWVNKDDILQFSIKKSKTKNEITAQMLLYAKLKSYKLTNNVLSFGQWPKMK